MGTEPPSQLQKSNLIATGSIIISSNVQINPETIERSHKGILLNNLFAMEAPDIIIISQFKLISGGTLKIFIPKESPYAYEPNRYCVLTPISSIT